MSRFPDERRGSIAISVRPLSVQTPSESAYDSDEPISPGTETHEEAYFHPYQSLFGGPSTIDKGKGRETDSPTQRELKLSRRHSGIELRQSPDFRDPIISPTRSSFSIHLPELSTISERRAEENTVSETDRPRKAPINKLRSIRRQHSSNSFFGAAAAEQGLPRPKTPGTTPTPETPASSSSKLVPGRFITSEDIIARLQTEIPRRAKTAISQYRPPALRPGAISIPFQDEKMQVFKRGERSATMPPSLRRVGSQLDNQRTASAENLIFGERFTTPDRKGKAQDMTRDGVLEAWGERVPEPNSPTRPPSIRRRQSLKLMDLEQRLESLGTDNTTLTQEKANLEKSLVKSKVTLQKTTTELTSKIEDASLVLKDKNSEIEELNKKIAWFQEEVTRLSTKNENLSNTNASLQAAYRVKYTNLSGRYEKKQEELVKLSNENSDLKDTILQSSAATRIQNEIQDQDKEISLLREELRKAREDVRNLERKVMARQSNRYLDIKDSTYFANSAIVLFQMVQKWCEEFSRYSAGRRCVHVHRVTDDEIKERFEQVMLDDRGVRRLLKDRDESRRVPAFTAIMMRLIWEFVFTRYLFGLEVEERHKLLSLERTLLEVGMYLHSLVIIHHSPADTLRRSRRGPSMAGNNPNPPLTTPNVPITSHNRDRQRRLGDNATPQLPPPPSAGIRTSGNRIPARHPDARRQPRSRHANAACRVRDAASAATRVRRPRRSQQCRLL